MKAERINCITAARYIYHTQVLQAEAMAYAYRSWRRQWKGPGREYVRSFWAVEVSSPDCVPNSVLEFSYGNSTIHGQV